MSDHSKEGWGRHRGFIKDARGRKVRQIDPLTLHLRQQPDTFSAKTLRAITHEGDLRIRKGELVFLALGIIALCAVGGLFLYSVFLRGGLGNAPLAKSSALLYFCCMPWLAWFVIRRKRFHKIAAVLLRYGHCPHCGYNLSNLPTDESDGMTVCPECGCGWRLPDQVVERVSG